MPDFSKAKIYKIECRITGLIYIGSTNHPYLSHRLAQHTHRFNNQQFNQYTSKDIIKNGDYFIDLVELYPCETKEQLLIRERYWCENTPFCINKQVPSRTKKEYRELHKDKQVEYDKKYYAENKKRLIEQTSERRRQRKKENPEKCICDCGGKYLRDNLSQHLKTQNHQNYIQTQKIKSV
jgi:hypothetical protein